MAPVIRNPPPSRPVISGNSGLNRHLSEMISLVIEPVASESKGFEADSTGEMLAKIDELNDKLSNEFPDECPDQIGCVNASPSVNDPIVLDSSELGSVDAQSCVESNSNLVKGSPDGLRCVDAPSCVNTNSKPCLLYTSPSPRDS